jgi:hypothetical protein
MYFEQNFVFRAWWSRSLRESDGQSVMRFVLLELNVIHTAVRGRGWTPTLLILSFLKSVFFPPHPWAVALAGVPGALFSNRAVVRGQSDQTRPKKIIYSCSQKASLKCKTDPYKFSKWEYAPSTSVVLARWSKLSLFQLYYGVKIFEVIWKSFGLGWMSTASFWVSNSDC